MATLNLALIIISAFEITWATSVISPSSSMFSCLSDRTNSYFRHFETQRGKAEGAILCIFGKRLSWLKDCFFQLLYVYRKWQATVLTLHILCLCHLPNVLSTAGWIPNRCFLLLIFLFFSITPFTRVLVKGLLHKTFSGMIAVLYKHIQVWWKFMLHYHAALKSKAVS